jgi:thiol-disulfide isomerase/thioredoxin
MSISRLKRKPSLLWRKAVPSAGVRANHYWVSVCLVLTLAAVGHAQTATCPCEASAEVKAALKNLDSPDLDQLPYKERKARRLAALTALRRRFPGDLFVERDYQDQLSTGTYPAATIEEYRKLADEHKQDPIYLYLYARSLVGTKTPQAIAGFESLLKLSPGFAWAHLALARIYELKPFEDKAKLAPNIMAFMQLCPDSLDGYDYLRGVKDADFLKKAALDLRAKLQADSPGKQFSHYNTLWRLEFRVAAVPEHDKVRKAVLEDIARLKSSTTVTGSARGMWMLKDGYNLAGDKQGQRWAEDQILAQYPASSYASQIGEQRWQAEHPGPEESTPPDKKTAYYHALLERADERIKVRADDVFGWLYRFEAVRELKDRPINEVEDTVDHLLDALAKNEGSFYSMPPVMVQVAQFYRDRNIRLDRVPDLIEGGLKEVQLRTDSELASDALAPELRKLTASQPEYTRWRAWPISAGVYLKMGQNQKAQQVLAAMDESLSKTKPDASASSDDKAEYKDHQATYWEWKGRLAEAEGHKTDALAFYQHSIALTSAKTPAAESDNDDSVTARFAKLWKELGGSGEGLQALTTPVDAAADADSSEWQKMAKPLPAFELADLKGAKWSLADLKGKIAFVNVWATWCGPCRNELPHLQKLYDRLKDRKDVVLLSLNVDSNAGLIEPFMKDHAFTFPVVPAEAYVEDFLPYLSIPRNWIVTPDGTLSLEAIGFGGDGDKWVDEAIKEIEKAKGK